MSYFTRTGPAWPERSPHDSNPGNYIVTQTEHTNPELQLAGEFVQCTGCHVFLTGKAGTGKTTFLHNLPKTTDKRMVVTAPTGVAAINAGGVTLHSFFQLPLGPFVPGSDAYGSDSQRQFRFSREKKQIIQSLDLLVIDEISMVRADLLDAVDAALRRHRRRSEPFGGVQLLMIGDLHQLPPVVKRQEWSLLQDHYESAYFFSSQALQQTEYVPVELKHIYRQSDPAFIELLNQVRDNCLDDAGLEALNRRYMPNFVPDLQQGVITLTTHNHSAASINQARLDRLPSKEYCFQAEVSGDFSDHLYPVPASLVLKKGAQVMFVRNDLSPEKKYYNGKIGQVRTLSEQGVTVVCHDDGQEVRVEPATWENITYQINEESREIERKVVGVFEHYPIKPAWAITIHKSQGLTFEKAVIDARAAFTHGQVYVALSRCKTLEGVVLSSPVSPSGLKLDAAVKHFTAHMRHNAPTDDRLQAAKSRYQQKLLLECFDLSLAGRHLRTLVQALLENAGKVRAAGVADIRRMEQEAGEIFSVSQRFQRELHSLFAQGRLPEADAHIQERVGKGSAWFQGKLESLLIDPLQPLQVETDNAELSKKIGNNLENLKKEVAVKHAGIRSCDQGFCSSRYLRAIAVARMDSGPEIKKKSQSPEYTDSDIAHPELYQALKQWRFTTAKEQDLAPHQVLHQRTLIQIAVHLPVNMTQLKSIKGVGKQTRKKYGQDIVALVEAYRKEHGVDRVDLPEPSSISARGRKGAPPSDTKERSLEMFQQGFSAERIAEERGLAQSTIEGHLGFFIEKGVLDINQVLTPELQRIIEQALAAEEESLRKVKDRLGEKVSYGQIKMVLAHQTFKAQTAAEP